jgi:hypothetical protein
MAKFEYKLHRLPSHQIEAPINRRRDVDGKEFTLLDDLTLLGQDGWEIVLLWPGDTHILMKREATPNAQPKSQT